MFSNWRNFANDFVARSGDPKSSIEIYRQLLTRLRLFSPIKFLIEYSLFTIKQLSIRLWISFECNCRPPTPPTHNYHGCKLSFQLVAAVEAPEAAIKENPRLWLDTVQVSCSCCGHIYDPHSGLLTALKCYKIRNRIFSFRSSLTCKAFHISHFAIGQYSQLMIRHLSGWKTINKIWIIAGESGASVRIRWCTFPVTTSIWKVTHILATSL